MGNALNASENDIYHQYHPESNQAEKKAATKAIMKRLKEVRMRVMHPTNPK
jgi:hypothetical protein